MKSAKLLWLLPLAALLWIPWAATKTLAKTSGRPRAAMRQVPFPATEFFVIINGVHQGFFKGDEGVRGSNRIRGLGFTYELTSPRDPQTGLPNGKRQHHPITFTKEWGPSSPQIFQALATNENLKTVEFDFVQTAQDGKEFVHHRIKLINASVSNFRQFVATEQREGTTLKQQFEDVSLTFQKIELLDVISSTAASDSWGGGF